MGFGRSGGPNGDYGSKRAGMVVTGPCSPGVSGTTSVCWSFAEPVGPPGTDSNTCNGDSGGPLLIDRGTGPTVAGVTSGGDSFDCLPPDNSYDTDIHFYRAYVQSQGGVDLSNTRCGTLPQVGETGAAVFSAYRCARREHLRRPCMRSPCRRAPSPPRRTERGRRWCEQLQPLREGRESSDPVELRLPPERVSPYGFCRFSGPDHRDLAHPRRPGLGRVARTS